MLQLMRGSGRHCLITATSEADDLTFEHLWLVALDEDDDELVGDALSPAGAAAPSGPVGGADDPLEATAGAVSQGVVKISGDMTEELDLVEDDTVRALARQVLTAGAPDFVAGHELDGEPVEAAWPEMHVGVLGASQATVTAAGWDLRPVEDWSIEALLEALEAR